MTKQIQITGVPHGILHYVHSRSSSGFIRAICTFVGDSPEKFILDLKKKGIEQYVNDNFKFSKKDSDKIIKANLQEVALIRREYIRKYKRCLPTDTSFLVRYCLRCACAALLRVLLPWL